MVDCGGLVQQRRCGAWLGQDHAFNLGLARKGVALAAARGDRGATGADGDLLAAVGLGDRLFVTDEDGLERRLGPGDMAFFPSGSSSMWHVPSHVRKLAVCRHSLPQPLGFALRAWKKLIAVLTGQGGSLQLANG